MYRFIGASLFLFLFSTTVGAQTSNSKILNGKIASNAIDLEGIYIINLKSDSSTLSENGGYFAIPAMVGDTLMFSAVQIKGKKVVVAANDFGEKLFFVKLEAMVNQLDEVKIMQYKNINAVSLGIIPAGQKHYSPAERRLKTASGLDATASTGNMAGGSISVDPLLNWMSGRTAMLKKEIIVEKKEMLLLKIENYYDTLFFIDILKIPADFVKGFQYYAVEDEKFAAAINAKNKTSATFILGELATQYLDIIKTDQQK